MRMLFILIATLVCAMMSVAADAVHTPHPHCLYVSPIPGARLVSSSTGLIMRFDLPVASASLTSARVTVEGSSSGPIAGSLRVSDDGVTVLFKPDHPFAPGETVHVALADGVLSTGGADLGPRTWEFSVSSTGPPVARTAFLNTLREEISSAAPPVTVRAMNRSALKSADGLLPNDFPPLTLTTRAIALPGGLYLSSFTMDTTVNLAPYLMVLDDRATPLFSRKTPDLCFDFKRQDNGQYTYFAWDKGYFIGLDSTYQPVATYKAGNGQITDGHELRLLPNGHALLLATEEPTVDMSALVPGGKPNATVLGSIIQELDQSGDVVFEWRSLDHFTITDATLTNFQTETIDAVHSNALEIDADGNILLSSRHQDEITKIDRQTGDIIWRWGGKHNQFSFTGGTQPFSHQHAIRRLANGHYTLFDNGNGHIPPLSRAMEFVLDTLDWTATLVWQYIRPNTFSSAMGYVQRLEDGNTLIGWGATTPSVTVVTPGGKIVYELSLPGLVYSYRAYTLPEITSPTAVGANGPAPSAYALDQNYPNPFNPSTTIRYGLPGRSHVLLTVYNTLGEQVAVLQDGDQEAGYNEVRFDGSHLSSGLYFYRIQVRPSDFPLSGIPPGAGSLGSGTVLGHDATGGSGSFTETKKLVLVR